MSEERAETPDRSRRALITAGVGGAVIVGAGALLAVANPGARRSLQLTVNGQDHEVSAAPETPLLYVLRNDLGLKGPHFGCGLAECGACSVVVGGQAIRSCVTPVSVAAKQPITTLEGLGSSAKPHPLQQAFVDEQAAQCGYCINGMIMEAYAFLQRNPKPTEAQIKTALNGHLCRCGTYMRIVRAVKRASTVMSA
jgi:nicotinate dehydrogenase subunit A